MSDADVVIIGAGVIGCAIAHELSHYDLRITVVEREADVCFGTSSRNSGVLHSGIHYTPGTARARLSVRGNLLMRPLCAELGVPCEPLGKLTVAYTEDQVRTLYRLKDQGERNGVPGLRILGPDEMSRIQQGVTGLAALHSPSTAIIDPMRLTIALSEAAHANGVTFLFEHEVQALTPTNTLTPIMDRAQATGLRHDPLSASSAIAVTCRQTSSQTPALTNGVVTISTRVVIDCAGLQADTVARAAGIDDHPQYPCRGEYLVLDKRQGARISTLIYPVPGAHSSGLGIHLTKTTDGTVLVGPSNEYISRQTTTATTAEVMRQLHEEAADLLPTLTNTDVIRSFAGIRPKLAPPEEGGFRDFVIEDRPELPGFILLSGIESPGLTSAPAIAEEVRDLVARHLDLLPSSSGTEAPRRLFTNPFRDQPPDIQERLVMQDPDYAHIICRCEQVTKAEVLQAIDRILGPITLTGIKNRVKTGMGRCQGGFCTPRIIELLIHHYGLDPASLTLKGKDSPLLLGYLRTKVSNSPAPDPEEER